GNTFKENGGVGIDLNPLANNNTLVGNICQGNGYGIMLGSVSGNSVVGNTCEGSTFDGIFLNDCDDNTIIGNCCNNNTGSGIYTSAGVSNSTIGENTCNNNTENGITVKWGHNNTVSGNSCHTNVKHGIHVDSSSNNVFMGNNCIGNDSGAAGLYDGICIEDDSDYNLMMGNICNDNGRWGISIGIVGGSCVGNWVKNNFLRGNTSGCFIDGAFGENTVLATFQIQLIQGTTFISAAGEAWGWEIDAADEFALGIGWVPREVQQVVRIR
ncbi:unnamed protein product, partial [marine sediment metagenome]